MILYHHKVTLLKVEVIVHNYKPWYKCRRSIVALVAITCLTAMAMINKMDTSTAIAMVVTAVCGANAGQAVFSSKKNPLNLTSSGSTTTTHKASQQVDNPDA